MGFLASLGRCIVTLLNILFVIVSLVLIAGGAIAYKASDISFIKDIEDTIKSSLNTLATNTGASNSGISSFSITEFLDGIALCLIISGCILLFLSFFGCCGACCKFRTLVFIYGLIVSVLLLAQIVVVILMYAAPNTIQGSIKDVLQKSLKNYKGLGNSDATTLGWMFVMQEMDCCGVSGYQDFSASTNWDRTPGNVTQIDAPLVCCKTMPTDNSDDATKCARTATLDINTQGCFDAVWNVVLGNPLWAGVGLGSAFAFQLLLIIFSILMYVDMKNEKKKKVYPKGY